MALELRSVSKAYGRRIALDRVSLHVRPGDCYGFLGHNGAGKTTALRIALGLIRADSGEVRVRGFDAGRHSREARARQGGLIETPGFYPALSGRKNLSLAGLLSGRAACREEERLLETVGLTSAGDTPVGGYSQGMRQRLGIALALLGDPEIILLDEPMNGLDPEGIEEIRRLLARLTREEGRTVLLSSHQLHEIEGLCNRIGILRQGRLLAEAETKELLAGERRRFLVETDDDVRAAAVLEELGIGSAPSPDGGILAEPGEIPPGRIAPALIERGLELRQMSRRSASLEEIYLRLSRGEAPAPAAPARKEAHDPPAARCAPKWPTARALWFEIRRLTSHLSPWMALALPALLAVISVLRRWASSTGHTAEVERGELISTTLVTAFESFARALGDSLPLAAVVVAGLASQSIAGEFSRKTLRNLLMRPVGRARLAFGKAFGVLGVAFVGYAAIVVAALVASAVAFDFTDVVEILEIRTAEPWVVAKAAELRPVLYRLIPSMLAPLLGYAAVGFLAGAIAKRSATALALSTGAVVFLDLFRTVGRELGFERWLLSAHSPSPLGDTSYVAHMLDLVLAPQSDPRGFIEQAVTVPLLWAAACILLAGWIVRRRAVP